jgi:hypothetical protein
VRGTKQLKPNEELWAASCGDVFAPNSSGATEPESKEEEVEARREEI